MISDWILGDVLRKQSEPDKDHRETLGEPLIPNGVLNINLKNSKTTSFKLH